MLLACHGAVRGVIDLRSWNSRSFVRQMKLADGLWSALPSEVVEHVLAFLPVPDLCRYRIVCTKWNRLICQREFSARCAENAKGSEAPYIVGRYCITNGSDITIELERGVSIFDLKAKRWYSLPKDEEWREKDGVLAADGGLICQCVWGSCTTGEPKPYIVYIPIAEGRRVIPGPDLQELIGYERPTIAIAVDPVTHKYKIFHLLYGDLSKHTISERPFMIVYDSASTKWEISSQPPTKIGDTDMCLCSVVAHEDKLYTFVCFGSKKYRILSYTISQDMWEEAGVEIHEQTRLVFPELVVSSSRLFLMTWYRCKLEANDDGEEPWQDRWKAEERRWQLEVSEILIPDRTRVTIFEMSNTLVLQVFGPECGVGHVYKYPYMNLFVFHNAIILMARLSGVSILYDTATRSWDLLPRNPLQPLPVQPISVRNDRYHFHAKQTNLILPTTRW